MILFWTNSSTVINNPVITRQLERNENDFTYRLANTNIPGLIDANYKHCTRKENVKAEVHQHVPGLSADPDHTAITEHIISIFTK